MQLPNAPDIKVEQEQFIERIWGRYSFTGITELAKYMKKSYPEFSISDNTLQKIDNGDYLDSKSINEIISAAVDVINSTEDMITILKEAPPENMKNGYELYLPFKGYYITVYRNWNAKIGNDWDDIGRLILMALQKEKPNFAGIKSYALFRAFVKYYEIEGEYRISTVKLIANANNELNQDPNIRVWYNNLNDLIGSGIVYNTRSNKYGEMTILPETIPLVKYILQAFENKR